MIVACHTNHANFNFPVDTITINHLWQQFLGMGGPLGNNIFVLISGYFLIKSPGIKFRKLIDLALRMLFYSIIFYAIFIMCGSEKFSIKTLLENIRPGRYWFASAYLMMYLLHGWLNKFLTNLTRDDYKKFLMSIFLYWSIITMLTGLTLHGNHLTNFICLYSLAGYVRIHADNFGAGKSAKFIWLGIGFIALNYLIIIITDLLGIRLLFIRRYIGYFTGMMRPFTILAGLCLLIGFKNLNISYSKIINILGAATFGVYLIHENIFVWQFLWRRLFHNATYQDSPYLIPYSILVILLVYVTCSIIEIIRSKIFKTLSRGYLS